MPTIESRATSAMGTFRTHIARASRTLYMFTVKHVGPGLICSVAYFDPGNWAVDLSAGSEFQYRLLFIVLLSGLMAVVFQVLACRLGCVTGLDLASHCRLLLHDRPKHKLLYRWLILYPLYALSEIAIASTDLAELLGSAIALVMIFPSLPLWAGVLITASDVLFLLAMGDPLKGRPVKTFEIIISMLVFATLICMAVIISRVDVQWGMAFDGFVPSKYVFSSGGLYTSVGIIGATVMPHSLFLGSHLATQDRLNHLIPTPEVSSPEEKDVDEETSSRYQRLLRYTKEKWRLFVTLESLDAYLHPPYKTHTERENRSLEFVKAHLSTGIVDMVISLLGIAVVINALILILAGAVFYDGSGNTGPATLFDAQTLIRDTIGKAAALLFAIALLCAGQSASIIATLAGQSVSEGFLRWRVSPVMRRLITRVIGLIPSMIIAIGVGRPGINTLLIVSQVVLSVVLPFVTLPLVYLTSSRQVMKVRAETPSATQVSNQVVGTNQRDDIPTSPRGELGDLENAQSWVYFNSGWVISTIAWLIWVIIVVANVYVIVTLGMGES